jgi:multidrug transporter EmrE-like cation transporter
MLLFKRLFSRRWIAFLLGLVAFELLADLFAKQFAVSGNLIFAALALLGFVIANGAWLMSLRSGAQLGKGAVLFAILSGMGAVLIGLLVYREQVSPPQVIGLVLGIAAIVFFSRE